MASRFPPPSQPAAQPGISNTECEICGATQAADPSDIEASFARQYAVVHTATGHRVREDYVCADCGAAFLVGARIRANLAEEEG